MAAREKEKQHAREVYALYKERGICVYCHKNAAREGHVSCFECAQKKRKYNKPLSEETKAYKREEYAWYKAHGICTCCHCQDARPGKTICLDCFLVRSARRIGQRKPPEQKEEDVRRVMERYYWHKENGICVSCGKPASPGKTRCVICRRKNVEQQQRRKPPKLWGELGLCPFCGEPPVKGYKLCQQHLERARANMAHAREFIDREAQRKRKYAISLALQQTEAK